MKSKTWLFRVALIVSVLFLFFITPSFAQHMGGGHQGNPNPQQPMQHQMQQTGDMMQHMQQMMSRIQDMNRHMNEMMQGQSGIMQGHEQMQNQTGDHQGMMSSQHGMGMMDANSMTHMQEMLKMMEQTGQGMQQMMQHMDAMMKDPAMHQNEQMKKHMDEMGKHLNGMMQNMDRAIQTTEKMTGHKTPTEKK